MVRSLPEAELALLTFRLSSNRCLQLFFGCKQFQIKLFIDYVSGFASGNTFLYYTATHLALDTTHRIGIEHPGRILRIVASKNLSGHKMYFGAHDARESLSISRVQITGIFNDLATFFLKLPMSICQLFFSRDRILRSKDAEASQRMSWNTPTANANHLQREIPSVLSKRCHLILR